MDVTAAPETGGASNVCISHAQHPLFLEKS